MQEEIKLLLALCCSGVYNKAKVVVLFNYAYNIHFLCREIRRK